MKLNTVFKRVPLTGFYFTNYYSKAQACGSCPVNISHSTGTFTNSDIVNCRQLSGAGASSISNSGIINQN